MWCCWCTAGAQQAHGPAQPVGRQRQRSAHLGGEDALAFPVASIQPHLQPRPRSPGHLQGAFVRLVVAPSSQYPTPLLCALGTTTRACVQMAS